MSSSPKAAAVGGTGARVIKAGKAVAANETFVVARKTTSLHGKKYITPEVLDARVAKGELRDSRGQVPTKTAGASLR